MSSALWRLFADVRSGTSSRGRQRVLWLGAASFTGVLTGLCVSVGDYIALAWAVLLLLGIGALAGVLSRGERRRDIVALVLFAGALHMAVGVGIQTVATTFTGGFVTGDDAVYYRLASAFARYLQGAPLDVGYSPPLWGGDAYLIGAFAYLETALFLVFGPDVRIPILLNSALAIATALLVFDMTKRLFGSTAGLAAAAVVAFFPSLILWSALNLKDSLTITLAVLAIWAAVQFQFRPGVVCFVLQFAAAEALITLRSYFAATIAIAAFVSIAVAALSLRRRVGATALAGVLMAVIVAQSLNTIGSGVGEQLLLAFERERAVMAIGARTGFVPTPTPESTPAPTPAPAPTPLGSPSAPASATAASPPASGTPAESAAVAAATAAPATAHPDEVAPAPGRTLSYLPTGLAYAIFAPVPFAARRLQEIAAAPEMLVWYLLVACGAATVWRERRRWSYLAPLILAIGGLMLVLALAEGNVGTLFRHRAMVIPFAASLASPSLVALWAWRHRRTNATTRASLAATLSSDAEALRAAKDRRP
jgi:4-amino-4-deoxy-L-arabinose transferase-like glycosyltransferase